MTSKPVAKESQEFPAIPGYRVEHEIGRGAFGIVYKAMDENRGRSVALKTLQSYLLAQDKELVARFLREAKVIGRMGHPNIVEIYEVREVDGLPHLIMEYVEGVPLNARLEVPPPLGRAEALRLVAQIASALQHLHENGVVHRDIKPENILLTKHDQVKVMDFGIARIDDDAFRTRTGQILGTPHFMSPEQVKGMSEIDRRADIYSLGVLLYMLLCGRLPFSGESSFAIAFQQAHEPPTPPSEVNPDLSPALEDIILKAMAKEPDDRFQTAIEFEQALMSQTRDFLAGPPHGEPGSPPASLETRGEETTAAGREINGPSRGLMIARPARLKHYFYAVLIGALIAAIVMLIIWPD